MARDGAAVLRLRRGGRRAMVDRRLFPGLGCAIRHRRLCLPADARASDGPAISLALRAPRLAGLGGAALSSTDISTAVDGHHRRPSMTSLLGLLALSAPAPAPPAS